ncbi:putative AT hook motif-containing protein [Senna tora]|uniref:Putative AT hook motif-containing protein n=1 Tax=Senna tora TaxID=362788 RepID=A0A835CBU3_9FABA|nr:putative AT hook motif-containing protein [Senna tora]
MQANVVKDTLSAAMINEEYWDIGLPTHECEFCSALLWYEEHLNRARTARKPKFSLCCMKGKFSLPLAKDPPKLLEKLITKKDLRSADFMKEIRNYNNMFSFTSMGGKIDHSVNKGKRPEEVQFNASLVLQISQMLDTYNPLVMQYRMVKERMKSSNSNDLRLKLIRKRNSYARTYNLPTTSEVAALIVGNFDISIGERNIIVENKSRELQRTDETHPLYLPMQYPLLFPYGENEYHEYTLYRDNYMSEDRKQRHLTLRQYFAYKLQDRQRTAYVRFHHKRLRSENYVTLSKALARGHVSLTSVGKRIILPSSFTGGERYNRENFQDAMTICKSTDYKLEDRPDLVSRIFKIKLNKLIRDITKDMLFGNCRVTDKTSFDEDGYCKYRHRNTSNVVVKNGVELDNSKGHHMVTAKISDDVDTESTDNKDEIKHYYDCRYISPCEVAWRIFGFDINFREPAVDRLSFHLPNQQGIIFQDDDNIDDVVANATMKQSKFIAWFEANKQYPIARNLTYSQFLTKFVFKHDSRV